MRAGCSTLILINAWLLRVDTEEDEEETDKSRQKAEEHSELTADDGDPIAARTI